jgi:hypothetical protein
VFERAKTVHALDRAANVVGHKLMLLYNIGEGQFIDSYKIWCIPQNQKKKTSFGAEEDRELDMTSYYDIYEFCLYI